jgi:hypothetical protein
MKRFSTYCSEANEIQAHAMSANDPRVDQVIDRLPQKMRAMVRMLRQSSSRRLRIAMGILLTLGGVLWFLPIAGLWMLPIGLVLLADDVPQLRSLRSRVLDWVEHHHPQWLAHGSSRANDLS